MQRLIIFVGIAFAALAALGLWSHAADRAEKDKPSGLDKRVPWTTSRVRGSPEPPSPYRTEYAFPKLKFDEPLDITSVPGSERLFVTERYGRVFSFPITPEPDHADLLLDLNKVLGRTTPKTMAAYGFAAHPQFARNGFVYVTYVIDLEKELPTGTRVSRFHVEPGEPPRCDPKSEQILIEWPCGGHNGGCLKFGPDGYLYIATGDSSGIADQYQTGQDLTSLAGKILRIDVDHADPGKHYAIPPNNPFREVKGARPEIWAYGLRQPWKMSFDQATGDFWVGNVGQDLWEQIYLVEPGRNYGWSLLEGSHPFHPERARGPDPIQMPIVEHDHANFRSITGGFIYHGKRLPDLAGAYIYGDYDTGRVWMFRYDRQKKEVSAHRELVASRIRIVGFGEDASGELYLLDHMAGRISRLVPNPAVFADNEFPRRLSQTGLFASTREHQPAAGVLPYSINAPQWCDGAVKERFLALPGQSQIEFETVIYPQPAPGAYPGWKFPDGAVLVETLFLPLDAADAAKRRRLETRIFHVQRTTGTEEVGDAYWQGYTYVWSDDQTDAVLLEDPQGRDQVFTIHDPQAPGGKRQQTWHYPSRAECNMCHSVAAKYAQGVQTLQMNRDHDYGERRANQLRTFEHLGLFTKPLPAPPEELPRLVDYRDDKQGLELRARSYLNANCSHCHRKWGGGNAEFQLLATLEPNEMGVIGVRPAQGAFNMVNGRIIAPGDPDRSVLLYRMAKVGSGRMPRVASTVVDEAGVKLIREWIAHMPGPGIVGDASARSRAKNTALVKKLQGAEATGDELAKLIDPLLSSTTSALELTHAVATESLPPRVREAVVARGAQSEVADIRDLFERFVPEEKRVKRLGAVIKPEQILSLAGDAGRGRQLFFEASGVQCRTCHRVGGKGIEIGPDLDQIGKKYDRAQILDNILYPSKQIDPKYLVYLVETKQGQVYTGILVTKDAAKVVLKDATNKTIEVLANDVTLLAPQQKSMMPELLLRDLTAEQVADLTAFLSSLK
jgi:uncharacterized repeat protein (TIGR03806 family)